MAGGRQWADLGERAAWTLIQAGVGYELVTLLDLPGSWGVAAAGLLSVVKSVLAARWGNGTAATLPRALERV